MKRKVAVVGLGYVGLPVAIEFGKICDVIGFDVNKRRIKELSEGFDRNLEVDENSFKESNINYTQNGDDLKKADFFIITVPTPLEKGNRPDMSIVLSASRTVGRALSKGDIVVYESTVFPGATEEDCIPVLEKESGLKFGEDFGVGYSPERINPGDKNHTFTKIQKVVSGSDENVLETVANVYESVVTAGVFKAKSIKVAEAAKVIENTQRDINIAFMNELAIIFDKMDINTSDVLEAASTKWNFLKFYPGLVGGHCIGVDPYYLTHKAADLGYSSQVILSGRKINDGMGAFIATKLIKELIKNKVDVTKATVTILGLTFKENTPDVRNSKIVDIVDELKSYGVHVQITDPMAMQDDVDREYGLTLTKEDDLTPSDAVILGVAHDSYKEITVQDIEKKLLRNRDALVFGVRSHLTKQNFDDSGLKSWFL